MNETLLVVVRYFGGILLGASRLMSTYLETGVQVVNSADIVEIDAGDTYAYDDEGLKTQAERERKAADRIFGLLPSDQRDSLRDIFEEFEAYETPESKFAHSMDNFQPLLLNDSNGGSDWLEHNAKYDKIVKRQCKTSMGSSVIGEKTMEILDKYFICIKL